RAEVAPLALELLHPAARLHRDLRILLDALHHAADGISCPSARVPELRVAGEHRRAVDPRLRLDQDAALADGGERLRGGEPGGAAADDQYGFHAVFLSAESASSG